ncbi:MAG: hypothetical protein A2V96_02165 [Candidatus Yonathbacteria bacterium RBG_16_43_6]|uniref:Metallo-beta-lactamase domain-containing protein n=2 Tax=Parcubacteria group TaxID=1794811 RepID=A0A1G2SD45_9BACT|nr:MAG: hypothetical protein A2V96_02165 [Candidatus Yonathbacteria bacterium RBG_16_43_6]OHA82718.1 MAG: hypothetical protein A3B07_01190 [Candidatus Yonathbacteria bacterium RIFCSPLOWO2_01_FULL_43_27]
MPASLLLQVQKKYIQWLVLGALLLANLFIWGIEIRSDRRGELTVSFLDVGQGDAIYIEAPNGNQVLIDGGRGRQTLRALGRVMPFWDRSLDLVIATHPDQDHTGGLPDVLSRMQIDGVVTTENTSATGVYEAFENEIQKEGATRVLARSGERIILDTGVVLEILSPDRNVVGWETNTASIVAKLSYGTKSFLFTGDAPQEIEKYIISKHINIESGSPMMASTVLKLGHHGSRTSTSRMFLSAVNPSYAIISAGKENPYGHPHKEVVNLLDEFNIPSFSTAERGTITFVTDGEDISVKNER